MSREHRDDVQPQTIDTYHSWVFVLILNIRSNGAYADAHSTNEDEGIKILPLLANITASDDLGIEFSLEILGNLFPCLANGYDSYLLHRNISIGWLSLRIILVGVSWVRPSSWQASSQS